MHRPSRWKAIGERTLERFCLRVARTDALLELSFLGLVSGVVAGVISILFRLVVEQSQAALLTGSAGDFESMESLMRLLLPILGGAAIGLLLHFTPKADRLTGVAHVMERLAYYQGRFPLRNALVQFIGGAIALVSGQSVGREGPGVHLGVAAANIPAQSLGLPNNSLRTLAACGTAAAIAASFNTPLAGVVFAVEVLLFEYTVAAFAPVLLAAVVATTLSRLVFGSELAFSVPPLSLGSLAELPNVLLMGLVIGVLAAAFIRLLRGFNRLSVRLPVLLRATLAGAVVGLLGLVAPQVMGIGYDTVNSILTGNVAVTLLLFIVAAKLAASTLAVGFGIPGGLIGPALVVGAATGGVFAQLVPNYGLGGALSVPGFYVLLGMGAMMAATLQAPLAGLVAILELTGNPNILFPGMLAVMAAILVSGQLHGRESMYLALMRAAGKDYRNDPIAQSLRQVGVAAAMERDFVVLPQRLSREALASALEESPRWILLERDERTPLLLPAVDAVRALNEPAADETAEGAGTLDLLALPGERMQTQPIDLQATLQEAWELMGASGAEALIVTRHTVPGIPRTFGVLTREVIENSYRL